MSAVCGCIGKRWTESCGSFRVSLLSVGIIELGRACLNVAYSFLGYVSGSKTNLLLEFSKVNLLAIRGIYEDRGL